MRHQSTPRRVVPILMLIAMCPTRCPAVEQASDGNVVCPPSGNITCPTAPQPTNAEIRGAMFSLYFYAYKWDVTVPPKLKPMPLNQVICTLNRDRSRGAEERRRLAIMKLVGSLKPMRQGQVIAGPPQICAALLALHAPPQIFTQVQLFPVGVEHQGPAPGQRRPTIEQQTQDVLAQVSGPLNNNCAKIASCAEPPDAPPQTNAIAFLISVDKKMADVKAVMDPQTWDECNSNYFSGAYIAAQKNDGSPVIDDKTGDAEHASNPPPPGSNYGDPRPLPFFEHVDFNPCGTPDSCANNAVSFKSILNLVARDGTDPVTNRPQHKIDYKFSQCTQSNVLGSKRKHTGIDIDDGFVKAIDRGGADGTLLSGCKAIKFSSSVSGAALNTWAQAVLPLLCDEIAGKAGGGVCCNLGP